MASKFRIILVSIGIILLLFNCRTDQEPTNAEMVIEASYEAMGGKQVLDLVQTLTTVANCNGPRGAYTTETHSNEDGYLYFKQDFTYRESNFIAVIYDSLNGYQLNFSDQGIIGLSPERIQVLKGHEFHMMAMELDHRFQEFVLESQKEFLGIQCYWVKARDHLGQVVDLYFDKKNKLLLGLEIKNPVNREENIQIHYDQWVDQDGLFFAKKIDVLQAEELYTFEYETIEVNAEGINL